MEDEATATNAPPPDAGAGLVLEVSELRQSVDRGGDEDNDLLRTGFGFAGILALAAGGYGLWRGFAQRT